MCLGKEDVKKMREAAYKLIRLNQAEQKERYDANHHIAPMYEVDALYRHYTYYIVEDAYQY